MRSTICPTLNLWMGSVTGVAPCDDGLASARSSDRYHAAPRQRIIDAVVQLAYPFELVSLFADREIGADNKLRWKVLDREADSVRRLRKSSVSERLAPRPLAFLG